MKNLFFLSAISALLMISACKKDDENPADPENPIEIPEGYSMVWSDEFDDQDIDASKWTYETGDGTDYGLPAGWGNNEKQIYTKSSENSSTAQVDGNSVLAITALEDNAGGYTSAKLTTNGLFSMRFGRIDVRAKMPEGKGLWPAIWMLGDNNDEIAWPGCGEIDIVEVLGHQPSVMYSTLHYANGDHQHGEKQKMEALSGGNFSDGFHVFTLEWDNETLTFAVDGNQIQQFTIEEDMKEFQRSFYLILNVAVGGYWPGDPDGTTTFPQQMLVDYVRVFTKDDYEAPEAPPLDIEEETIGQTIDPKIGTYAIKEGFTDLGNLIVVTYGPGEPIISSSSTAIDGERSMVCDFPGGDWGGIYLELESPVDLSNYSYLKFSLNKPASLVNAEIKLESPTTNMAIFLKDYSGVETSNGFMEYTIPLADFTGLDLTEIRIPFAIWNPQVENNDFAAGTVLVDKVYFTN
jgi:beta-glucanase (GH16 family)